mmetsp:Transcript_8278/g.7434  ORF Transcript_8278/g.7434 Transcript_8278/m.7434 type:complete len:102 (+) Transcript_8278:158-463(+)
MIKLTINKLNMLNDECCFYFIYTFHVHDCFIPFLLMWRRRDNLPIEDNEEIESDSSTDDENDNNDNTGDDDDDIDNGDSSSLDDIDFNNDKTDNKQAQHVE